MPGAVVGTAVIGASRTVKGLNKRNEFRDKHLKEVEEEKNAVGEEKKPVEPASGPETSSTLPIDLEAKPAKAPYRIYRKDVGDDDTSIRREEDYKDNVGARYDENGKRIAP